MINLLHSIILSLRGESQVSSIIGANLGAYLYQVIFWAVVGVFVIVEGLLLYAAIRFPQRTANNQPSSPQSNVQPEIIWTVVPAVVTAVILFFIWQAMVMR